MSQRTYTVNKLGLEDLLFGVGTTPQERQGKIVNVTKINASNLPFDATQTLAEVLEGPYLLIVSNLEAIQTAGTNAIICTEKALIASTAAATATAINQKYISMNVNTGSYGTQVSYNSQTNTLTIPAGVDGTNGLTPNYSFTYNPLTGNLEYSLVGYTNDSSEVIKEW